MLYPHIVLYSENLLTQNDLIVAVAGLALLGITLTMVDCDRVGGVFFVLALNYKQMCLYYALPFFVYVRGSAVLSLSLSLLSLFLSFLCRNRALLHACTLRTPPLPIFLFPPPPLSFTFFSCRHTLLLLRSCALALLRSCARVLLHSCTHLTCPPLSRTSACRYMLSKAVTNGQGRTVSWAGAVLNLVALGATVIAAFAVCWLPFLSSTDRYGGCNKREG